MKGRFLRLFALLIIVLGATPSMREAKAAMPGAVSFTLQSRQTHGIGDWSAFNAVSGDVNKDGQTDLIFSSLTNQANVARVAAALPTGDGFDMISLQVLEQSDWSAYDALAGDVNADGRVDLIFSKRVSNRNVARVALARTSGDGFDLQNGQILDYSNWSGYDVFAGDTNGDGRADLIFSRRSSANNYARVALAQANGISFDLQDEQTFPQSQWDYYEALAGDVNGDGRTDLIFVRRLERLVTRVALAQPGGASFDMQNGQIQEYSDYLDYRAVAGDVNRDGRCDLILVRTYVRLVARVALAEASGTGFELRNGQTIDDVTDWNPYRRLTGDVNGDGRSDLILSQLSSTFNRSYVALADGRNVFLPAVIK